MADTASKPNPYAGIKIFKEYFGYQQGQSLKDFAAECKELNPTEFKQIKEGIENGSLTY